MAILYRTLLIYLCCLMPIYLEGVHLAAVHGDQKTIFVGLLIKSNDALIPKFLSNVELLDFDKKRMMLQFNVCSEWPSTREYIRGWIAKNRKAYKQITYVDNNEHLHPLPEAGKERFKLFGMIKNGYLQAAKESHADFCAILESDVFLAPSTLSVLVAHNKPIISPMLRPIPESQDPFRNFFAAVSDNGYYKDHPLYWDIADRRKIGTFKVPCVQSAYLIDVKYADALDFQDASQDWEFIAFSRNARKNNITQYITNEREFGSFLHFKEDLSNLEMKNFNLVASNAQVTPRTIYGLLEQYIKRDPAIRARVESFPFDQYAIYRVNNKDLYYVDEMYDFIKSCFIKRCAAWEENIHAELKKYTLPGTVALDIGGHIGTHTLNLSRLVGEKGCVHVFEPQAKLFVELVTNMALNGCANIVFHHNALGLDHRLVQMGLPKPDNEGMAYVMDESSLEIGESVYMKPLDSLQLTNVSILKMDVEGHEMEVLEGAKNTIAANKPVMIIELLPTADRPSKIEKIEKLGYTASLLAGEDYLFIPRL